MRKKSILYITYNGILEPLGQSQILPYIFSLSEKYNYFIYSFENSENINTKLYFQIKKELDDKNIVWFFVFRRKNSNLINFFNFIKILLKSFLVLKKNNITIIHSRSFIPSIIGCILKYINSNIGLIYDIRGFWIDEKVDRLGMKKNYIYLCLKYLDKIVYNNSDIIICLTKESARILKKKFRKIDKKVFHIIPTCADPKIFYPISKKQYSFKTTFCYMGSVGNAYNFEKVSRFVLNFLNKDKNSNFLILNNNDHYKILNILDKQKFPKDSYELLSCNREDLNNQINSIDIGCFYANENSSIKASFPTRIAEFLLAGKPILCNQFNEDIKNILDFNQVGFICNFEISNISKDLEEIKYFLKKNTYNNYCRKYAIDNLSLNFAKSKIENIYHLI